MNHLEISEIVAGKVFSEEIDSRSVNPEWFFPPYDELIRMKQGGAKKQDMFNRSPDHFQSAVESTHYVNGALSKEEYLQLLEKQYNFELIAGHLDKISKQLRIGNDENLPLLNSLSKQGQKALLERISLLSEVESGDEYMSSGVPAIDKWLGGIPKVGMILLCGDTGRGKTTFALSFIFHFLMRYPEKRCLYFTLEMTKPQIKKRAEQIFPGQEVFERIHVVEDFIKSREILPFGSTIDNLGLMVIDFVNLIPEQEDPQSMAIVYRDIMFALKELRIPALVPTQVTLENGGIPRTHNARMSKMAGNLAVCGWSLYDPYRDSSYDPGNPILPRKETRTAKAGYLISDKARFGVPPATIKAGWPGAIQFPVRPMSGWDLTNQGSWFSLINN